MRNVDPMAREGMRVRMIHMDDEIPVDEGLEGTIEKIDDIGTLHVRWDDGRLLGVIPNEDNYELLPSNEEQIDFDVFEGSEPKLAKGTKNTKASKNISNTFKKALSKSRVKNIKIESKEDDVLEEEITTGNDIIDTLLGIFITSKLAGVKTKEIPQYLAELGPELILYFMKFLRRFGYSVDVDYIRDNWNNLLKKALGKYYKKGGIVEPLKDIVWDGGTINYGDEASSTYEPRKRKDNSDEEELEETTTAGAAGAFVAPLGNKKDVVRKGFAKQVGANVVSKGTMKNPLGKIYTLSKKNESKIIKASDILSEITTSNSQKLRDKPGAMDGSAWVGKKGWERKDEILWPGGEIADIMAKLDIDWNDSDLTLTDKETDKINEGWLFKSKEDKLALSILKRVKDSLPTDLRIDDGYGRRYVDTDSEPLKGQQIRFTLPGIKRDAEISVQCGSSYGDYYCILKVNNKILDASDWAIGKLYKHLINILISRHDKKKMTQIQSDLTDPSYAQDVFDMLDGEDMVSEGKKKKVNKKKVEEEDLEEATTFSSVFGGGFPVTPFMWAKKGKHLPSKKSLYKGGKIVQKVGGDGILSEDNEVKDSPFPGLTSTELRDILTHSGLQNVKYVKKDTYSTDSNEDFVRNLMKHKPKILQGYMELAKTEEPLIASLNGKTYIVWKKLGGNTLFNEINKIKWVKGGKFVKIKDKCAKYNNKPWCSQGAVDNPLELSDTTFENVKNIAKKTGIKEIEILDKIKNKIMSEDTYHKLSLKDRLKIKLAGISDDKVIYNLNNNLPIDWKGSKEGFYEKMEPRKNYTGSN